MENKNISQIALERIKVEGIKPISSKVFSIKRVLFWVVVIISLIIGAFTFSLILSALFNNDWDLYNRFGFNFILKTLPYFWFISLILFIILGEYYYRKTLLGYRHTIIVIVLVYMISTVFFGSIFYLIKVGDFIEQSLTDKAPCCSGFILNRYVIWSQPEEGLLSGRIIRIGENEIGVLDMNNYVWIVYTKGAFTRGQVEIEIGERIKIIGDKISDKIFNAEEIRPWIGARTSNPTKSLNTTFVEILR